MALVKGMLREEVGILVVDDVNTMRVQIRQLLNGFGFRNIAVCESGEAAEVALKSKPYQLILCDWHMGVTSGLDLLKKIRADERLKDIGFIMVTAEMTRERVLEAIQAGVDDYLIKPLTLAQIQSKVYGVLLRKQVIQ